MSSIFDTESREISQIGFRESFGSVSLVRQGEHTFYSLTLPSEVLARTCFVIKRDEDPKEGFQRELDQKRAKEIAAYIDNGLGTIPSSIVLSAQEEAELQYDSKRKGLSFNVSNRSFLIIDGQHRVYGFMLAKKAIRIPVIIYDGLSKRDETRLFIDINSKQKGVSTELLLDIKKLADYENKEEEFLREIYDNFFRASASVLYNRLSPSSKASGKITRTTFNAALKPLVRTFGEKSELEIYQILNNYLFAFRESVFVRYDLNDQLFNNTVFRAICGFFPIVASKVKDRYGALYEAQHFYEYLSNLSEHIRPSRIANPGNAYKPLVQHFEESLKGNFTL